MIFRMIRKTWTLENASLCWPAWFLAVRGRFLQIGCLLHILADTLQISKDSSICAVLLIVSSHAILRMKLMPTDHFKRFNTLPCFRTFQLGNIFIRGGTATIQRGTAEVVQHKVDQTGTSSSQEKHRIGYIEQWGSEGWGSATIQRGRQRLFETSGSSDEYREENERPYKTRMLRMREGDCVSVLKSTLAHCLA